MAIKFWKSYLKSDFDDWIWQENQDVSWVSGEESQHWLRWVRLYDDVLMLSIKVVRRLRNWNVVFNLWGLPLGHWRCVLKFLPWNYWKRESKVEICDVRQTFLDPIKCRSTTGCTTNNRRRLSRPLTSWKRSIWLWLDQTNGLNGLNNSIYQRGRTEASGLCLIIMSRINGIWLRQMKLMGENCHLEGSNSSLVKWVSESFNWIWLIDWPA